MLFVRNKGVLVLVKGGRYSGREYITDGKTWKLIIKLIF